MTDRQKFVYDLALQHVSADWQTAFLSTRTPLLTLWISLLGMFLSMLQWTKEPWMPLLQRSKRFDLCLLE